MQYTYYTQHTNQFLTFVGNNAEKNAMESEFSRQFLSAINYIWIHDILIKKKGHVLTTQASLMYYNSFTVYFIQINQPYFTPIGSGHI